MNGILVVVVILTVIIVYLAIRFVIFWNASHTIKRDQDKH